MLLILNGGDRRMTFALPEVDGEGEWVELVDTASREARVVEEDAVHVTPHSLVLLRYTADRRLSAMIGATAALPASMSGSHPTVPASMSGSHAAAAPAAGVGA